MEEMNNIHQLIKGIEGILYDESTSADFLRVKKIKDYLYRLFIIGIRRNPSFEE